MNSVLRKLQSAVVLLAAPALFCADIATKPTYEQIVDKSLGEEALAQVGGATTINGCDQ